jgi:hypothetical protein
MKMKGRKATCFIVLITIFTCILVLTIFFASNALNIFGSTIIGAMVLTGLAFVGGTVWKDYIKSKHFRKELYEENQKNI